MVGALINYDKSQFNLPSNIKFAIKNSVIKKALKKQGIKFYLEKEQKEKTKEALSNLGKESSVLISCW